MRLAQEDSISAFILLNSKQILKTNFSENMKSVILGNFTPFTQDIKTFSKSMNQSIFCHYGPLTIYKK